jgi:hypothetical protein
MARCALTPMASMPKRDNRYEKLLRATAKDEASRECDILSMCAESCYSFLGASKCH